MAAFYVGQRVRIVRSMSGHAGLTGVILQRGHWAFGDRLPDGHVMGRSLCGYCNLFLRLDGLADPYWPANTDNVEPITTEGAAPSEFATLADLLTSLDAKVPA